MDAGGEALKGVLKVTLVGGLEGCPRGMAKARVLERLRLPCVDMAKAGLR